MAENKKKVHAALEKSISNMTGTLLPLFDAKAVQAGKPAAAAESPSQEEQAAVLQDAQKKLTAAANALQKYSAACLYPLNTLTRSSEARCTPWNTSKQANSCSGVRGRHLRP